MTLAEINQEGIEVTKEGDIVLYWGGYPYEIEADRIDTEKKLLIWVEHLTGKTWMDIDKLHKFMNVAAKVHDLNIHGFV